MTKQNLRMIDTTIHQLTAAQVLEQLIHFFREDTSCGVIIATSKGRGDAMVAQIRVELSRAKKEHARANRPFKHFGFTSTNLELELREHDVRMEYRLLNYRITALQTMKNYAIRMEGSIT